MAQKKQVSQREAVYNAITKVTGQTQFEGAIELSKEEKQEVYAMIAEGFRSGEIVLDQTPANEEKLANPRKMQTYISGLVSNWTRKDPRFNGNTKYEAKNPGSRTGSSDPQLKALRQLANKFANDDAKLADIYAAISKRQAALKEEKRQASFNDIDVSALPPELTKSLGLSATH